MEEKQKMPLASTVSFTEKKESSEVKENIVKAQKRNKKHGKTKRKSFVP